MFKVVYITNKKLSRFMLLTTNVSSYGLVSILTSIISPQDPLQCLKNLFMMHSGRFLSYSKKRKISQNDHSLSLAVICCHSLSLIVPLVVIRCTTRCNSLLFVITRCTNRCHWIYHSSVFL